MSPPLLAELRAATAASHRGLEARIAIARPEVTLAEYTATLRAYLGYYLPLETRLESVVAPVPALQWECRRKSHLLAADLERLTGQPNGSVEYAPIPALDDLASAVGAMYVLEGATLGGRYLLKTLGPQLAASDATAFLQCYGAATAQRWRQFVDYLWEIESPRDRREAVTAAVATFSSFESWLDECEVLR